MTSLTRSLFGLEEIRDPGRPLADFALPLADKEFLIGNRPSGVTESANEGVCQGQDKQQNEEFRE